MNEQAYSGSNQASLLFNALFGSYFENHNGYIALTWRAPREYPFHDEFYSDIYFATSRAGDLREQRVDTFFAVAPRNRPNRKKRAISDVLTLHIDADGKDRSVERSIKSLNPSALVRSGGKFCFHPYFFLEEPARTPENTKLIEELNKRLATHIGVDPKSTIDTSRILRVPGTYNMKNPKKPQLVELVELDPKLRYPLDYFVDRFKLEIKDFPDEKERESQFSDAENRGHYLSEDQRAYVDELLRRGLFEAKSRNESMMLLIRYCYEQNMDPGETSCWVRNFFRDRHNHQSRDWLSDPDKCTQIIEYAVQNWWKKAYPSKRISKEYILLSRPDYQYVEALLLPKRDKEFLYAALLHILNNKQGDTIVLSARQLRSLCNVHSKNEKEKLALLKNLGIIELKKEAKRKNRLAREFIILYQFDNSKTENNLDGNSFAIHQKASDRIDALIMSGHTTSEIRGLIPTISRQHIFYRRRRLEGIAYRDQFLDG